MNKTFNIKKEEYRGTIKQLMKVRGLRAININNYFKFIGETNNSNIHSIKANFMNGYVDLYSYGNKGRAGVPIQDGSVGLYELTYKNVMRILNNEENIPSNIKRNILVKVSR